MEYYSIDSEVRSGFVTYQNATIIVSDQAAKSRKGISFSTCSHVGGEIGEAKPVPAEMVR